MNLMYAEPCPVCRVSVEFDPYDGVPASFGVPFNCPHCGASIELDCDDVMQDDGKYEWSYWFTPAADKSSVNE